MRNAEELRRIEQLVPTSLKVMVELVEPHRPRPPWSRSQASTVCVEQVATPAVAAAVAYVQSALLLSDGQVVQVLRNLLDGLAGRR